MYPVKCYHGNLKYSKMQSKNKSPTVPFLDLFPFIREYSRSGRLSIAREKEITSHDLLIKSVHFSVQIFIKCGNYLVKIDAHCFQIPQPLL